MFSEDSFSTESFSIDSFLFDLEQRLDTYTAGFIRKRRRLDHPPTDEQIRAERIRLGIIEARQERKRVLQKVKSAKNDAGRTQELQVYAYLLNEEIDRLQAEYKALKADLEAQGEMIRSAVITRAAMEWIEEEIRLAKQEEEDISFLLAMLSEM